VYRWFWIAVRPLRSIGGASPGHAVRSAPTPSAGFEAAGGVGQRSVDGRLAGPRIISVLALLGKAVLGRRLLLRHELVRPPTTIAMINADASSAWH
jgi:hypothetical protein